MLTGYLEVVTLTVSPSTPCLHTLLTCAGIMYGSAVFGRAFRKYTALKRGVSSSSTNRMLRTHGLLDENGVVKCSVGLAFLDDICLV